MATHEVDTETFEVKIFVDEQAHAMIVQPMWPNGEAWSSFDEADEWGAKMALAQSSDTEPFPPLGPGEEPIERIDLSAPELAPVEPADAAE